MTTLLYSHEDFYNHDTPDGHPETRNRYREVLNALAAPEFENLMREEAPLAALEVVKIAHPDGFIRAVEKAIPQQGKMVQLDPDTWIGAKSLEANLRSVGAGIEAAEKMIANKASNAFIAARPPGHHAETDKAMGFCIFNSAAVTALHAQAHLGCEKVAVVDFDVHHGNGTQEIFWDKEKAFFASSHEWPQYPGTGAREDRGVFENVVNTPLASGEDGSAFQKAWGEEILPALSDFDPDLIILSAGFDGHAADPLGGLNLVEGDFAWVTKELKAIAKDKCKGRMISFMEGGYNIPALAKSAASHVKALAS